MFKGIPIPDSFTLINKGTVFLSLRSEYKDLLLQQGIENVEAFLLERRQDLRHHEGRTPHPSVSIREGERMVVRRYSHGGLFRALTRDLYLFGSRSFREVMLTEEIRARGIPTIRPLGAIHQRVFHFFYRAYLLSLEVSPAKDLIQYLREMGPFVHKEALSTKREMIRSAGLLLRQFHQAGFFHADLQLKNILVAGDRILLIDFDRSYRKELLSTSERIRNLLRLNRSAEKWEQNGLTITRADRWRFFLAYAGGDLEVREAMRRALRMHSFGSFLHRLVWKIKRGLGA